MQSRFFWKQWPLEYKWIWYVGAFLFVGSLAYLWSAYFIGIDGIIHWDSVQEQKVVESTIHSFNLGPFTLEIPAESYVLFDYFNGSWITPNTEASYLFLGVLILASIVLLTVITVLERFWFYVGMGLFILFVVSLRFEVLGLFGFYDRIPIIGILLIYAVPAVYFSSFNRAVPFLSRLLVFAGITGVLGVLVNQFAMVQLPLYHLTTTGYASALILSVLFIFSIAHEILAGFVFVVNKGSSKNLKHFSIISAIYLVNVFITALHEMSVIEWNFIYVNIFLLLSISALLGIWGFREREPLYENIISFAPGGALAYLALGAICFMTTGQLLATGNDPAVKIIRDAVIFSHAGYGIIFIIYLFSNFILLMARSVDVSKILYKPNRMPYFTYRFAGTIAVLAFIFVSDWKTYVYNGLAGYYNSVGDLYTLMDNDEYAESFYRQSQHQTFANHKASYALGLFEGSRLNMEAARENYRAATVRFVSPYALTNKGNLFIWENDLFGGIHSYRESLEVLPQSGELANNLGFAYAKVHNLDSALVYLDKARKHDHSRSAAETNFFAMAALEFLPFKTDSILEIFDTKTPATWANALAIASRYKQPLQLNIDPFAQSRLDLYQATLLNNYLIHQASSLDSATLQRAERIANDSLNIDYSITLKVSLAHAWYHQGNVAKALQLMAEQVFVSQADQGKFNYIMALWALEQGNPQLASAYFTYADTYEYKEAPLYNAIALTESRKLPEAIEAWNQLTASEDEGTKNMANRMIAMLTQPLTEIIKQGDPAIYQYCRYRLSLADSVTFNQLSNKFANANYKAQALLDRSNRYYEREAYVPAIQSFNRIAGLQLTDKDLYDNVRYFELKMLASRGEIHQLATQINKGLSFDKKHELEKWLYTALISESSGDTATAAKYYKPLASYNPYFEEGVIAASEFYKATQPTGLKAYEILAEAIQINTSSVRLYKAYIAEALRKGFDNYAYSAQQQLDTISGD